MFGEVTAREQSGWQLRATRVLSELLQRAIRENLPPVRWTVSATGDLVAHCYAASAVDRRTAWETWRTVLGAAAWPERTDSAGITHLHAVAKRFDGLVDVTVLADVFPDDDQPEEASRP
jgi:hypothetical protein